MKVNFFIGAHFLLSEDIRFDCIWVTFSNFDKWVSFHDMHGRFFSKEDEKSITITYEKCSHIKEKRCIELQSRIEKSFDEYLKLNGIIQNLLNFIIPNEVLIESIEGIAEASKSDLHTPNHSIKQQHIRIFYKSPISNMIKPNTKSQPLLFFEELKDSNQLENYMDKWFEISERFKPVFDLYFGVMYNPKMYTEFQFLGLAQALESYHRIAKAQKRKWFFKRAKEVYEYYSEVAAVYFKFNDKERFATKVKDARNYFSHWSENLGNKVVQEKDLRLLTKDLQLLLQLCLMTEFGFDIDRIKKIF